MASFRSILLEQVTAVAFATICVFFLETTASDLGMGIWEIQVTQTFSGSIQEIVRGLIIFGTICMGVSLFAAKRFALGAAVALKGADVTARIVGIAFVFAIGFEYLSAIVSAFTHIFTRESVVTNMASLLAFVWAHGAIRFAANAWLHYTDVKTCRYSGCMSLIFMIGMYQFV